MSFGGVSLRGNTPSSKYSGKKFSLLRKSFGGTFILTKLWNQRLFKSEPFCGPLAINTTKLFFKHSSCFFANLPSQAFILHTPHHKCLPGDQLPTYREMNLTREEWDWVSLKTDKHWWGIDTAYTYSPHS